MDRDFNIEKRLANNSMNALEDIIQECLCYSEFKDLEKNIHESIDKEDIKNLRRYRFELESIIDSKRG